MGIGLAIGAGSLLGGYQTYETARNIRQEKLEKKRTNEAIAKLEKQKKEEEQAEEQRKLVFFDSSRRKKLERRKRTQRTFAGMQQDFNPALMKQKLGQ